MATKTTEILAEHWHEEDTPRPQKVDRAANPEELRFTDRGVLTEVGPELALAPLVDKIAYGLARGLVVAMKELENHIASETRKVGDSVGRRLDTLQASFQDLSGVVSEQRSELAQAAASWREADTRQAAELAAFREENDRRLDSLQAGYRQLDSTAATLQEVDARQAAELSALRTETNERSAAISERIDVLCKELGVQQEDICGIKTTFGGFCARVDAIAERLDRQAEALRSMYATYAQRETELEQLVDGLARLRAYPAPKSTNGL